MTRSASVSRLRSEFDEFLFAPIGEEKNGMLLSVLSALARLDVDPWAEAAKLGRMSGEAATERMAALIAGLPDRPAEQPEARTIAARLIALLPRPDGSRTSPEAAAPNAGVATRAQTLLFVMFMAVLLGAQFLVASHQTAMQAHGARAPAFGATSPRNPALGVEQRP